jgi:hypothetical protein
VAGESAVLQHRRQLPQAKNLEANGDCVVSVEAGSTHIVLEGHAYRVTDEATLQLMTEAYSRKYDWPMQVRDGAVFDAEGNGGPVYAVVPNVVFGFGEEETFRATRWRFPQYEQAPSNP